MRYYVAADVHGFYSIFRQSLTASGFFNDKEPHKLMILGDVFDRGAEAREMQDFILDLIANDSVILVKGNHEDLFEDFVTVDKGFPRIHHVLNGTYDTAIQLTGFNRASALIRHNDFADAAKETPYYQKIIPSMIDYYETEHYVFVHGWIPCVSDRKTGFSYIAEWRDVDPIEWKRARWYNGMDAAQSCMEEKTILCGHYHASYGHTKYEKKGSEFGSNAVITPYYGSGIIALDACTAHSKMINVVVLEDTPIK